MKAKTIEDTALKSFFLIPGDLFVTKEPYLIKTLLGTCVSVCLFDPINMVAGMNHYLLPEKNDAGSNVPKYGTVAIKQLYEKMIGLGAEKQNLIAKIFGGISTESSVYKIGQRNIEMAEQLLYEMRIPIVAKNVGGTKSRKIILNSTNGQVLMKYLQ